MTNISTDDLKTLNELQAFDAMVVFLRAYWTTRGEISDDIANLLSDVSRTVWANEMPGDPAAWSDWQIAVTSVLASTDETIKT